MAQTRVYTYPKPAQKKDRLTFFMIVGCFALITAALVIICMLARNLLVTWQASLPADNPIKIVMTTLLHPGASQPDTSAPVEALATPDPWKGSSRVTILVMGLDYRDWQAGDVPRTDSMWVLTVDPVSKTAGMMSIPRDTWTEIPGYGASKINMAYFYGEVDKLPGGGPALAVKTVEKFLDVPINYYVVVDFNAFVNLIDKLDGISIDVPAEITVDPLGPGNTVTLEPGRQRVFGAVALAYARDRYTDDGDFDRMKRQQQVIMAIRERVMDPNYLPVLITHSLEVYNLISANIHTDLKLQDAIQLAWLGKDVKVENIKHVVLDHDVMSDGWSPQGWSIELPDMDKVHQLRDEIFTSVPVVATQAGVPQSTDTQPAETQASQSPSASPVQTGDVVTQAKNEQAKISVENGTEVVGLAGRTSDYLKSNGMLVLDSTDAQGDYPQTTLIDCTGKSATIAYLAQLMNVDASHILSQASTNSQADVIIIVGQDWADHNPMP